MKYVIYQEMNGRQEVSETTDYNQMFHTVINKTHLGYTYIKRVDYNKDEIIIELKPTDNPTTGTLTLTRLLGLFTDYQKRKMEKVKRLKDQYYQEYQEQLRVLPDDPFKSLKFKPVE